MDICIKCNEESKDGDPLNNVGVRFKDGDGKKHPVHTLLDQAVLSSMDDLAEKLRSSLTSKTAVFIHLSCRKLLYNTSRPKKKKLQSSDAPSTSSNQLLTRTEVKKFNFRSDCFYCGSKCEFDCKNPDRNPFQRVTTMGTKIHSKTIQLCKSRDDTLASVIMGRLLSVNDLVAVEARYHKSCRSSFENPVPEHQCKGRPPSYSKTEVFEKACKQLEDEMELYTVKEFKNKMFSGDDNAYSTKWLKVKLTQKYGNDIQFVTRQGQSDITLLSNTNSLLTEKWYKARETNSDDEEARIIVTAAKLIRNKIRNFQHCTAYYPNVEDVIQHSQGYVPHLLELFMTELIKNPLKQQSLAQAIFAGARPRSLMPLQFALAVTMDNRYASKELSILMSRLGYSSSYDEVRNIMFNFIRSSILISLN